MKTFLLVITIVMFGNSIKETPKMLSKTFSDLKYYRALERFYETVEKKIREDGEAIIAESVAVSIMVAVVRTMCVQLLMTIYYLLIGSQFQNETIIVVLSALQIIITGYNMKYNVSTLLARDFNRPFNRGRFFNLCRFVLDYTYYPMVLDLLIFS